MADFIWECITFIFTNLVDAGLKFALLFQRLPI